jgi:hypothetical protein
MTRYFIAMPLLVSLLTAGCMRGDGRQSVAGTVLLDGKPLASGVINFQPVGGAGNSSGGAIAAGEFTIPVTHGLQPGKYAVTIHTVKPTGRTVYDRETGSRPELIPVRFQKGESLDATVVAGATNRFDFKLTTAP